MESSTSQKPAVTNGSINESIRKAVESSYVPIARRLATLEKQASEWRRETGAGVYVYPGEPMPIPSRGAMCFRTDEQRWYYSNGSSWISTMSYLASLVTTPTLSGHGTSSEPLDVRVSADPNNRLYRDYNGALAVTADLTGHPPAYGGQGITVVDETQQVYLRTAPDSGLGFTPIDNDLRLGAPLSVSATSVNEVLLAQHGHEALAYSDGWTYAPALLKSDEDGNLRLNELSAVSLTSDTNLYLQPVQDVIVPVSTILKSTGFTEGGPRFGGWQFREDMSAPGYSNLTVGKIYANEMQVDVFVAGETRVYRGKRYLGKSFGIVNEEFTTPSLDGDGVAVWFDDAPEITGGIFGNGEWLMFQYFNMHDTPAQILQIWGQVYTSSSGAVPGYLHQDPGDVSADPPVPSRARQRWRFVQRLGPVGIKVMTGYMAVDLGLSGDFYMVEDVVGANRPYITMQQWVGSNPYSPANIKVVTHLGNLDAISGDPLHNPIIPEPTGQFGIWAMSTDYLKTVEFSDAGIYLKNADIQIANGALRTVWIESSGDVRFGTNIDILATTSFKHDASTGDILLGRGGVGGQNITWDQSSATLVVTGQIVIKAGSTGIANTDAGGLALQDTIGWGQVDDGAGKPADNATVGATWGTNVGNRPAHLTDSRIPTALSATGYLQSIIRGDDLVNGDIDTGLNLTPTHMGYYDGSSWKTYIHNSGTFFFRGNDGGYLGWNGLSLDGVDGDGIIQWYANAETGKLYAGGGEVVLSRKGVNIKRSEPDDTEVPYPKHVINAVNWWINPETHPSDDNDMPEARIYGYNVEGLGDQVGLQFDVMPGNSGPSMWLVQTDRNGLWFHGLEDVVGIPGFYAGTGTGSISVQLGGDTATLHVQSGTVTDVAADWIPDASGARDLGTAGKKWDTLYVNTIIADSVSGDALSGNEWRNNAGDMYIMSLLNSGTRTLYIANDGSGSSYMNLDVDGNITLTGTVDSVDVATFKSMFDTHVASGHHAQVHVLATNVSLGADHTMSGATAGHVLRATAADAGRFMQLLHTDLGGITIDQHHARDHVLATNTALGAEHSISGASAGHVLRASAANAAAFAQLQHTDLGGVTADQHHAQSHVLATNTDLGPYQTITGASAGHVLRARSATTANFQQLPHDDLSGVTANQHHNQSHVLATNTALGADHTVGSSLTAGHVLRAMSTSTAYFAQLQHDDLGGVTSDQHHTKLHGMLDTAHHNYLSGGAALDVFGLSAPNTLAKITPSYNVSGETSGGSLLRSNIGVLTLNMLITGGTGAKVRTPLIDASAELMIAPFNNITLNPGMDILVPVAKTLKTDNFSDAGITIAGWQLAQDPSVAGISNFSIHKLYADELQVEVFVAGETRVYRGRRYLGKSFGVLSEEFTSPAVDSSVTVWFDDAPEINGKIFTNGDWLLIQRFNVDTTPIQIDYLWGQVYDSNYLHDETLDRQRWTFTLRHGTAGLLVRKGYMGVDLGVSGDFYMIEDVIAANRPFITMQQWTGANPYTPANIKTVTHLGNLNAISVPLPALVGDFGIYAEGTNGGRVEFSDAGIYLRNANINIYNGLLQTVGIQSTGNVAFGKDVTDPLTTSFTHVAATGNIILGKSSGQNVTWDQAAGVLTVYGKIVIAANSSGIGSFSDAGALATASSVNWQTQVGGTGKPADSATVGAVWGTNLTGRPVELTDGRVAAGLQATTGKILQAVEGAILTEGAPATGLNLTKTYMGYFNGATFQTFIKSDGKFYFAGEVGATIAWDGTKLYGTNGTNITWYATASNGNFFFAGTAGSYISWNGVKLSGYNGAAEKWFAEATTGNFKLGKNVAAPATTSFFHDAAEGDITLGLNTGQNVFWDQSLGTLTVTGKIVIQAGSSGIGAFSDAGSLATASSVTWGQVANSSGRPADNATVGATWGVDIGGRPVELTDNRITTALNSSGYLQSVIRGALLVNGTFATGLNLTPTYMGYYSGTAWKVFINNSGQFYFNGNTGATIGYDGSNLFGSNVAGTVTWYAAATTGNFYFGGLTGASINWNGTQLSGYNGTRNTWYANAGTGTFRFAGATGRLEWDGTKLSGHNGTREMWYANADTGFFRFAGATGRLEWNGVKLSGHNGTRESFNLDADTGYFNFVGTGAAYLRWDGVKLFGHDGTTEQWAASTATGGKLMAGAGGIVLGALGVNLKYVEPAVTDVPWPNHAVTGINWWADPTGALTGLPRGRIYSYYNAAYGAYGFQIDVNPVGGGPSMWIEDYGLIHTLWMSGINQVKMPGLFLDTYSTQDNIQIGGSGFLLQVNTGTTTSVAAHWVPSASVTWDLGSAGVRWRKIYVQDIVADTVTGGSLGGNTWRNDASDMYIYSSSASARTLFVANDGTGLMHLNVEGNIVVGGTVDGVDISVFKADYDAYVAIGSHPRLHAYDSTLDHSGTLSWTNVSKTGSSLAHLATRLHTDLTFTGLQAGQVWRASAAGAASFALLAHTDLDPNSLTPNQHHAQVHSLLGTDHSVGSSLVVGQPLVALTTSTWGWGSTTSAYISDFAEAAQDAVGVALIDSLSIDFTYTDATNQITAVVLPAGVNHNALLNLTTGDPHTQYVHISTARTISAQHTFSFAGPPFLLAAGAQNQTVTGLKAHYLAQSVLTGSGLAGGGPLTGSPTLSVVAGTLITVAAGVGITPGANYQFIATGAGTDAAWANLSTLAGSGLLHTTGVLSVNVGDGMQIVTSKVTARVDTTRGMALDVSTGIGLANAPAQHYAMVSGATPFKGSWVALSSYQGNGLEAFATSSKFTLGLPTTIAVTSTVNSVTANSHVHAITTMNDVGSAPQPAILASTAQGGLRLELLTVDSIVTFGADVTLSYLSANTLGLGADDSYRSASFTTGMVGWNISGNGDAEFNNIEVRGSFKTAVFQYGVVQAVGGSIWLTPGAGKLYSDSGVIPDAPATFTINIEIPDGIGGDIALGFWAIGDIIRIREMQPGAIPDGQLLIQDLWATVSSVVRQSAYIAVTAVKNMPATPLSFTKGAAVLNYKGANSGFIQMTSDAANAPYIQMGTHSGTPWSSLTLRSRMGNLNGSYGYSANSWGFGAGQYGVALQSWITVDDVAGIRLGVESTIRGQWRPDGTVLVGNPSSYHSEVTDLGFDVMSGTTSYTSITSAAIRVGAALGEHVLIDTTSVNIKNNASVYASFGVTTTLGLAGTPQVVLSPTDIQFKDAAGATRTILGPTGLTLGVGGAEYVEIAPTTGFRIFAANIPVGQWASSGVITLGRTDDGFSRIEIDETPVTGLGIRFLYRSGGADATMIRLANNGAATFTGTVTATTGSIGGWTIATGLLSANNVGMAPATFPFYAGSNTATSAPFRVSNLGVLTAISGTVGGFTLAPDQMTATNIEITTSAFDTYGPRIVAGAGSSKAGIASAGSDGPTSTIGLWAGATIANRHAAPFRVTLAGVLTASGATITGASTFSGSLSAATGTFSGSLSAATGTFSGALSGATGTFSGALSGATGSFSGAVTATSGSITGALAISGATASLSVGAASALYVGTGAFLSDADANGRFRVGLVNGTAMTRGILWDGTNFTFKSPTTELTATALKFYNATPAEMMRVGELYPGYGYAGSAYGIAIGRYALNIPNITIDEVDGLRIRRYGTVLGQWDIDGSITIGEVASNKTRVVIDANGFQVITRSSGGADSTILQSKPGNVYAGFRADGNEPAIWAGSATSASAPFRVDSTGNVTTKQIYIDVDAGGKYSIRSRTSGDMLVDFTQIGAAGGEITNLARPLLYVGYHQSTDTFSTETSAVRVGYGRSGNGISGISLHARAGGNVDAELVRAAGIDGGLDLKQTGAGALQVVNNGTGVVSIATASADIQFVIGGSAKAILQSATGALQLQDSTWNSWGRIQPGGSGLSIADAATIDVNPDGVRRMGIVIVTNRSSGYAAIFCMAGNAGGVYMFASTGTEATTRFSAAKDSAGKTNFYAEGTHYYVQNKVGSNQTYDIFIIAAGSQYN